MGRTLSATSSTATLLGSTRCLAGRRDGSAPSPLALSRAVPKGVSVSADGLAVSRVGPDSGYQGAVVEPAVRSAERCYAEWVIEEADEFCVIMIGVTDLDAAPPAGQYMHDKPGSRM